jgi:Novel STAND NTPase 1
MTEPSDLTLSAERPWPGMRPYREQDAAFFFGRDDEATDLQARVERARLTLLYGRGGLGKSSLLRAGLAPRLATLGYLFVYLRPRALIDGSRDPVAEAKAAIEQAAHNAGVEATAGFDAPSLWELFHRDSFGLWDKSNRLVVPVLAFDQFEEIFQIIDDDPGAAPRVGQLLEGIAELVENRLPRRLAAAELPDDAEHRFDVNVTHYRVVLSFREDYLPHVRKLRTIVPAVIENHVRLEPLTGRQALEVVERAGGPLIDASAAEALVRSVGRPAGLLQRLLDPEAAADGEDAQAISALEVEPAVLSVVCFYLNAERQRQGQSTIDVGLVKLKKPEDIFDEYYRAAMAGVSAKVRHFVESRLVTEGGERVLYPMKAIDAGEPEVARAMSTLLDQGILRKEWFAGEQRLEISHDLLLRPIREAAAQVKIDRMRRQRRLQAGSLGALLLLAGVGYLAYQKHELEVRLKRTLAVNEALLVAYSPQSHSGDVFAAIDRVRGRNGVPPGGVESLSSLLEVAGRAAANAAHAGAALGLRQAAIAYAEVNIDLGGYSKRGEAVVQQLREEVGQLCSAGFVRQDDEMVTWLASHGGAPEACQ